MRARASSHAGTASAPSAPGERAGPRAARRARRAGSASRAGSVVSAARRVEDRGAGERREPLPAHAGHGSSRRRGRPDLARPSRSHRPRVRAVPASRRVRAASARAATRSSAASPACFHARASRRASASRSGRGTWRPRWGATRLNRMRRGSTRSGSSTGTVPRPSQVGHAPTGLLNENVAGDETRPGDVAASAVRAIREGDGRRAGASGPSTTARSTPTPRSRPWSTEAAKRSAAPPFTTRRSTTTSTRASSTTASASTSSSLGGSGRPPIRTRTKPSRPASSECRRAASARGARRTTRVASGRSRSAA